MKDKLIALFAKLWMPTLVRHVLAAAGGYTAAAGIDGSTTTGLFAGGVLYVSSLAWSLVQKRFGSLLEKWGMADVQALDAETAIYGRQLAAMFFGAVTSQLVAALSGYLLAAGYAGDVNDPTAVLIFLGNLGLSKARGPASAASQLQAVKALILGFVCLSQISCTVVAMPVPGTERRAVFVNADVQGLHATPTSLEIESINATEPIKAQAEAGRTWLGIWGNTRIAVKGLDAATSLGGTVTDALK